MPGPANSVLRLRGHGADHIAILTDGGQDPGLAALVNSLVRNGFDGILFVGWRGTGADLFDRLAPLDSGSMDVQLVRLETDRPLTCFKADFLQQIWELIPDAASLTYMDCDIVLGCEWPFIRGWVSGGLAIVEDLPHRPVGSDHPLRHAWTTYMEAVGVAPVREMGRYFNAGFVGIPARCRAILPVWSTLSLAMESLGATRGNGAEPHNLRGIRSTGSAVPIPEEVRAVMLTYWLEDQDALNMALMATEVPVCAMGPDAMGFTTARTPIVVHALGPDKPWSTSYLWRLLRRGVGPTFADDMWWSYSERPIVAQPHGVYVRRRWAYRTAKALGRYV